MLLLGSAEHIKIEVTVFTCANSRFIRIVSACIVPAMHIYERALSTPINALKSFLALESKGGILLVLATIAALLVSNSPLAGGYQQLLDVPIVVAIGELAVDKPLLLWINDGLMAVFFLLIGLEVKREMLDGQLSSKDQIILPAAGAIGGFAVPVLIYWLINRNNPGAANGWAIPAATDIAFALGVLSVLGSRVPLSLKVFLTTVAIFDDIAAIVVIAVFYTSNLSIAALTLGLAGAIVLVVLNRAGVTRIAAYIAVGVVIWVCVLKSGVHATLAGFVVALAIPMRTTDKDWSPLKHLEHALHPWVVYSILPIFAFANAGVSFAGISSDVIFGTVSLGIAAGLFIGKQLGVFTTVFLIVKLGLARLPKGATWLSIYGVAAMTGIGFTMSFFIGSLAFPPGDLELSAATRVGVLSGSLLSASVGYMILRFGSTAVADSEDEQAADSGQR